MSGSAELNGSPTTSHDYILSNDVRTSGTGSSRQAVVNPAPPPNARECRFLRHDVAATLAAAPPLRKPENRRGEQADNLGGDPTRVGGAPRLAGAAAARGAARPAAGAAGIARGRTAATA